MLKAWTPLPREPGVYRFFSSEGQLIYVGKAKNLSRRVAQYFHQKRLKKSKKMRTIVSNASRVELEVCQSHLEACLLETSLIQEHRPRWNVVGAFSFLYPFIGVHRNLDTNTLYLCRTTLPEAFTDFSFFGAYRSREITLEAFHALLRLLGYVGHRLERQTLPSQWLGTSYSTLAGFRGIEPGFAGMPSLIDELEWFLKGESKGFLEKLILALVENASARHKTELVQQDLNLLRHFWRHEAQKLHHAVCCLRSSGQDVEYPVAQKHRDLIFIRFRELHSAHNGLSP